MDNILTPLKNNDAELKKYSSILLYSKEIYMNIAEQLNNISYKLGRTAYNRFESFQIAGCRKNYDKPQKHKHQNN